MNTKEWNNAKVGQIIRGEKVKAIRKNRYGISGIITKEGNMYSLYTMPNVAPDEVLFDSKGTSARLGVWLESF